MTLDWSSIELDRELFLKMTFLASTLLFSTEFDLEKSLGSVELDREKSFLTSSSFLGSVRSGDCSGFGFSGFAVLSIFLSCTAFSASRHTCENIKIETNHF